MGQFLNSIKKVNQFTKQAQDKYFVDKSGLIEKLNALVGSASQFVHLTRPRRFGKSINAMMLASYYCKNIDAANIFDKLKIGQSKSYRDHLNKHNVIYISFNSNTDEFKSYDEYITYFREGIKRDLKQEYPDVPQDLLLVDMLNYVYEKTEQGFIFIIDEWDYIFNRSIYTEANKINFLTFLEGLLKDKSYVELAYMTGLLPLAKYFTASFCNMFPSQLPTT